MLEVLAARNNIDVKFMLSVASIVDNISLNLKSSTHVLSWKLSDREKAAGLACNTADVSAV